MPKDYDIRLRGHHLRLLFHFGFYRTSEWEMASFRREWLEEYRDRKHTENAIRVLERIFGQNVRLKLTDGPDDICRTCPRRKNDSCRKFIPGASAAVDDREKIRKLGLKLGRSYSSRYLLRKTRWLGVYLCI